MAACIAWSDDIQLPGTVRSCIDGASKPVAVFQRFGERLKAHLEMDGSVSFELYAYTGMCCSRTFVGKLTEDGTLIRGTWPSGANQAAHNATWKKMPGDSCVAPDSEQAAALSRFYRVTTVADLPALFQEQLAVRRSQLASDADLDDKRQQIERLERAFLAKLRTPGGECQ